MTADPRHVLVVGASRGIGLELVRQYRAAGVRVVATARDDAGLARLSELGASAMRLDVTDAAGPLRLGAELAGADFDTVILNAGILGPRTSGLDAPSDADFDAVMHTNVLGAMRMLPCIADALASPDREDGALPRIGVLSSRGASMGLRRGADNWLYRASKAALNSVLKDAATLLAGRALCVALHPGWVRTDMGGAQADLDAAESAAGLRRTLAALDASHHGGFLDHDGTPLAW